MIDKKLTYFLALVPQGLAKEIATPLNWSYKSPGTKYLKSVHRIIERR